MQVPPDACVADAFSRADGDPGSSDEIPLHWRTAFRARLKFSTRHFCPAFAYQIGAVGELAGDFFDDTFEFGAML